MKRLFSFSLVFLFYHTVYSQCIPPTTPVAWNNGPVCTGKPLFLFGANYVDATYRWTGPNGFTSTLREPVINAASLTDAGIYSVTVTVNGCTSAPGSTTVIVKATPQAPVANNNSPLCSGATLNLTAGDITGATYNWVGQNGFVSDLQNPNIPNTTITDAGIYLLVATVDGCTSSPVATSVIINQVPSKPVVSNNGPLCTGATLNLIANSAGGVAYNWTGPNGFLSAVQNPVINNVDVTNAGIYKVNATSNGCTSVEENTNVIIQPTVSTPQINSNAPLCAGTTLNLSTSLIAGISYNWSGPNGFTSSLQNPVVNNIGISSSGLYTLTITGCNSASNTTSVIVNPVPSAPSANTNGNLCIGQTLNLVAGTIAGASYSWTGPNGFISSVQNPVINNVSLLNSGTYNVIAIVNNCASTPNSVIAVITDSARASAGNDQIVCPTNPVVKLSGIINGGTTGIWSTNGSGTFTPNNTTLNASYNISNTDILLGSIKLILTSTNNGACPASASSFTVSIPASITVNAGADQSICASNNIVNLNGQVTAAAGGIWTTSGTGSFFPDNATLNATYNLSTVDKTKTNLKFTLTSAGNGNCPAVSDDAILTIYPGPTVNAGPDRFVEENDTITLQPVVNGSNLQYVWTPALYLNSNMIKNPVVTGINDQAYTLEVTDGNGCTNKDDVTVTVLKSPGIPNTFTPNNDGINDTWIIKNLEKYADSKIQVFNRYGQLVFESKGYTKPWDGTMKGKSLPFGTYYYVIEPGNGVKPLTGYVTIIK